jgi:nitrous oxidase accessory protein
MLAAALLAALAVADFDLQRAIAEAEAGERIVVPEGVYRGPVLIEKPLELVADGRVVIDGGGGGDVVRVSAPDVTIRGFEITNTGTSLDRENAGVTVLAPRVVIEDNVFRDVLFGVYLKEAPDSVIRGNTIGGKDLAVQRRGDGIRIWRSDRTLIEHNTTPSRRVATPSCGSPTASTCGTTVSPTVATGCTSCTATATSSRTTTSRATRWGPS